MLKSCAMKNTLAILALLWISPAFAAPELHLTLPTTARTLLDAVALNGAAGTRTFTWTGLKGTADVRLFLFFDYAANAGNITTTCTLSQADNTLDFMPTTCSDTIAAGVNTCTLSYAGIWKTPAALSADKYFSFLVPLRGAAAMECIVAHDNTPGATDKITVYGIATTE